MTTDSQKSSTPAKVHFYIAMLSKQLSCCSNIRKVHLIVALYPGLQRGLGKPTKMENDLAGGGGGGASGWLSPSHLIRIVITAVYW